MQQRLFAFCVCVDSTLSDNCYTSSHAFVSLPTDGLTWGRVEGDDPTGAIMAPYDKSDPNQKWMSAEAGYRDDDNSLLYL